MPDSRCPILDARYSMLDARCSMPDARCSILDARGESVRGGLTLRSSIKLSIDNYLHNC